MDTIDTTALADKVGITRDKFPEFWGMHCTHCVRRWGISVVSCPRCHKTEFIEERNYLPSPLSDDPRACLWEPFLMRALGWEFTYEIESGGRTTLYDADGNEFVGKTFTAALYAAIAARCAQKHKDATHAE